MKQQRSFDSVAKDVRLAQRGDAPAMERILADVQDMVYYNCLRMLRKEQSAQDAAQDVLITVYRKIGTLSDPTAYFGWVKRITANHCKNLLCKVNREFLLSETEDGEDPFASFTDTDEQRIPDKALDNAESRRMVNEIVDALPDEQRMCVMLYYYDEMKTHEIADALSVSEGTVKSRLNYARKRIRTSVDALAQQGVKLYGGMPLPFLGHILRESVSAAPALAGKIAAAAAATAAAGASAAAATGASAAAATGTAAGLGAFFASVMGKVVIAAVAVAVLGGASVGVAGIVQNRQAAAARTRGKSTAYICPNKGSICCRTIIFPARNGRPGAKNSRRRTRLKSKRRRAGAAGRSAARKRTTGAIGPRRRPKRRRTNTLPDSATRLRRCTGLQTKRLPSKPWTEPMRCGSTTTWGIRGHGTPAFPARSGIRGGISTGIRNSRGI